MPRPRLPVSKLENEPPVPRPLSELEGCTLGVAWLLQPATRYQIRMRFAQSPGTWWSGSAGAIYPLMQRLRAAGLVTSTPKAAGKRRSETYRLTPKGRVALRAWLWSCLSADEVEDFDPIRIRVRFLLALPATERARFVRDADAALERLIARIDDVTASHRQQGDRFRYLTGRAAWHTAMARRRWLAEVDELLRHGGPTPAP